MTIINEKTGTGFTINGDSVMLSKYGKVYPTIDGKYHPNPGTEEDEYSEIERCIDWLYLHNFKEIYPTLNKWVEISVADELTVDSESSDDEIISNVFFNDTYTLSSQADSAIRQIISELRNDEQRCLNLAEKGKLSVSRKIASFINEKFLRVRAGGKLNPEGTDSIYFRISSHGYNWHRDIVDFLWDTFKSPDKMPRRIWVGHDAETNPPEVVLFDGTPEDLFDKFDMSVFEDLKSDYTKFDKIKRNEDRRCDYFNRVFHSTIIKRGLQTRRFV